MVMTACLVSVHRPNWIDLLKEERNISLSFDYLYGNAQTMYLQNLLLLYHFDRKFTNSENLLAEMADKFSFEF